MIKKLSLSTLSLAIMATSAYAADHVHNHSPEHQVINQGMSQLYQQNKQLQSSPELGKLNLVNPHKNSKKIKPAFSLQKSNSAPSALANCATAESLAELDGAARIAHLKATTDFKCLENSLWKTGDDLLQGLFNQADMIDIANEAKNLVASYDGTNNNGLANFILYLRVGRWAQWGKEDIIGPYTAELNTAVFAFLDAYSAGTHFYNTDETHGDILREVITLMGGNDYSVRYIDVATNWLGRYNKDWGYAMQASFTGILTVIFRGSFDNNFKLAVANDPALVDAMANFLTNNADLIGHNNEFQFNDTTLELTRMLGYGGSVLEKVKPHTKNILDTYSMTGAGSGAWINAAQNANWFDGDNCSYYGTCDFEKQLEAQILPINHECSTTLKVRAQALTNAELGEICQSLAAEETYFHQKLKTNNKPVADDNNSALELVIYDSSSEYKKYSGIIFGNSTDNGGIYLEGDPSVEGNIPRFFAYEAEWEKPEFVVWNLNHEYTHYLDGRFNLYGDFQHGNAWDTVWWSEGLAEYIAKQDLNDHAVAEARKNIHNLSELFRTNYNDHDSEQIYTWGYLAVRFMFEKHHADIDSILALLRGDDFKGYDELLTEIGTRYDSEFNEWLAVVQSKEADATQVMENGDTAIANSDGNTQPAFITTVPADAANLTFTIQGGTGDADLYVKHNSEASLDNWDFRPWRNGNNETVEVAAPAAGDWHFMLAPYKNAPFANVTVEVSWEESKIPNACANGESGTSYGEVKNAIATCISSGTAYMYIYIPEATSKMTIQTNFGDGDVSIYTHSSTWADSDNFEHSSTTAETNKESVIINDPAKGWHYITLAGHNDGLTLQVDLE